MKNKLVAVGSILLIAMMIAVFKPTISAGATGQGNCGPFTGAIWTSDSGGNPVNQNIYAAKTDVYLQGGPTNGGQSLTDGTYYYRVVEPNGTNLYTDGYRTVVVTGGVFPTTQLAPFNDTSNPGGEYKVEVSMSTTFPGSCTKSDNFKVVTPPPPVCSQTGDWVLIGTDGPDVALDGLSRTWTDNYVKYGLDGQTVCDTKQEYRVDTYDPYCVDGITHYYWSNETLPEGADPGICGTRPVCNVSTGLTEYIEIGAPLPEGYTDDSCPVIPPEEDNHTPVAGGAGKPFSILPIGGLVILALMVGRMLRKR